MPIRKAHPIRGILWGFLLGLGATVIAILLKIIPFDLAWAAIVLGGGIVVGILWSTLGPAKKPKGDPPWRQTELVTERPDWDAGPVPPSPPVPPGTEPLLIQPLDVEPLDFGTRRLDADVPADAGSGRDAGADVPPGPGRVRAGRPGPRTTAHDGPTARIELAISAATSALLLPSADAALSADAPALVAA